jgi:hypothetical protein
MYVSRMRSLNSAKDSPGSLYKSINCPIMSIEVRIFALVGDPEKLLIIFFSHQTKKLFQRYHILRIEKLYQHDNL